jgi:hypothetical protein
VETGSKLKWGVERRLEFIEFRLFWEGGINRSDITEFFGVSVPQASKDLNQYLELAPGNMEYDKSEKRYLAAVSFSPRFIEPDPDQYLAQLQMSNGDVSSPTDTWLSDRPDFAWMPIPHRRVEPDVLRSLLSAIREESAVEVLYQSMNPDRPEAMWRSISPHALGSDGLRWHVRAFCHLKSGFKDFLLSRCIDCRDAGHARAKATDDHQWYETVDVKLIPNPKLSDAQQEIIASDFDMTNRELSLSIRKALVYYFNKRLRLDVANALDDPREVPVVLADKKSFDRVLAEVTAK